MKSSGKILGIVLFSVLVIGLQNIPQASAAQGDLKAVIDTLEFDALDGVTPDIIQIDGDVFAAVWIGTSGNGKIATITIDNVGDIPGIITAPVTFDTTTIANPKIFHITLDKYGILFDKSTSLNVRTFTINNAGTTITAVSASTQVVVTGTDADIVKLSGATGATQFYGIAYEGTASQGFVDTISITSGGAITSGIDSASFNVTAFDVEILKVGTTDQKYAVAYRDAGDIGKVEIMDILDDGTGITDDAVTANLNGGNALSSSSNLDFVHVTGQIYAVAWSDGTDGNVETLTIPDNGSSVTSTQISTVKFDPSGVPVDPVLIQTDTGVDPINFIIAYHNTTTTTGELRTVTISANGNTISNVDTLQFTSSGGETPSIVHRTGDFYAIVYEGELGDGFVTSFDLGVGVDVTPPTPVITSTASPGPATVSPIPIVIDFGETVIGFAVGDMIRGGTATTSFGVLDDNGAGNFSVPLTVTVDGTITIDIPAGIAADTATNSSLAATQFSISFDGTAPSFSNTSPSGNSSINDNSTVNYTLSEIITSGTIVFTRDTSSTLGDPGTPHTFNLSGSELTTTPQSISVSTLNADSTFSTGGALVNGVIYDVTLSGTDSVGNTSTPFIIQNLTYDTSVPSISSVSPSANADVNAQSTIGYSLNKTVSSGSIVFTLDGGSPVSDANSPHTYNLTTGLKNIGAHNVAISTLNVDSTFSTGGPIVDGAVYDVTISVTDSAGNSATPKTISNLNYDNTAPTFSNVGPASGSTVTDSDTIDYTLSETITSGTIVFIVDSNTPVSDSVTARTYNLSGNELSISNHSISISTINADSTFSTNGALVNGALYDISISGIDAAGNASFTVNIDNLTISTTPPSISNLAPADNTTIGNLTTIDYTLSKAVSSGSIVFDESSSSALSDVNAPHTYSLTSGDLTGNPHSISIETLNADSTFSLGGPLVNGASYDVTISVTDSGGNDALPGIINNLTFDSTIPASLTTVSISSDNANSTQAVAGDIVTLTFTADGEIQNVTVTIDGNATTATNTAGNTWTATRAMQTGDTVGVVAFTIDFEDLAGNTGTQVTATTDGSSVTFTVTTAGTADFAAIRDGFWFIDTNRDGVADIEVAFGLPTDELFVGDFDGDGADDLVVNRDGFWFIDTNRDGDSQDAGDIQVAFGLPTDKLFVGDFDGDGSDDLVVNRDGFWFIDVNRDGDSLDTSDIQVGFGLPTDELFVGDFDGDGSDDLVVNRDGFWFVDTNHDAVADIEIPFGLSTDKAFVGDFDGDGLADFAVNRDGFWFVDTNRDGTADIEIPFGLATDIPLVGDFDGN